MLMIFFFLKLSLNTEKRQTDVMATEETLMGQKTSAEVRSACKVITISWVTTALQEGISDAAR